MKRYVFIGEKKNIEYIGFDTIHSFRHPKGSWNKPSADKGGLGKIYYNVLSWITNQNRKRILMENCRNLNKVQGLVNSNIPMSVS